MDLDSLRVKPISSTVCTLGPMADADTDGLWEEESSVTSLQLPLTVWEKQDLRGPGRREIGHGALASLGTYNSNEEEFPTLSV